MSFVRQKRVCDINNDLFLKLKKRAIRHVFLKSSNGFFSVRRMVAVAIEGSENWRL